MVLLMATLLVALFGSTGVYPLLLNNPLFILLQSGLEKTGL
jgi:hypothetical protein